MKAATRPPTTRRNAKVPTEATGKELLGEKNLGDDNADVTANDHACLWWE